MLESNIEQLVFKNARLASEVLKTMVGKDVEIIVLVESDDIKECQAKKKREPGSAKGLIWMADDFEKPLDDDMLAEFYK